MEENKKDTSFRIYGNFYYTHSIILKEELKKRDIPVKVFYASTGLGPEIFGNASFADHKIMIRGCDFDKVRKIQEELGIEDINQDKERSSGSVFKSNIAKVVALIIVFSIVAMYLISFINSLIFHIR